MTKFLVRRLATAVVVLVVLTVLAFSMVRLMPGDPAAAHIPVDNVDPAQLAEIRQELGLDRPWLEQYATWMRGLLSGDFGTSLTRPYEVGDQIAQRLPVSLQLAVMATIFSVLIGIPAGMLAAIRAGRATDAAVRSVSFVFLSIPAFVIGTVIVLVNSQTARLPLVGGWVPFTTDPGQSILRMLLPAFLLGLSLAAILARFMRGSLVDTLTQDYIRTARAKGAGARAVVLRHALRNALIPVTTVVGIQLATIIGGTIVIESVFALPGMGSLLIQAIDTADYPTIQAAILVLGALYVLISLIVDLLYPLIDPRVRVTA